MGIPADEQPRIFERFTRGAHPDRGGYGLGLYLVRHIVQAHGGEVEFSSVPGKAAVSGSSFPSPITTSKDTPMPKVLLVEDEEALARGLEFNLKREGFEVLRARRGDSAVDLIVRTEPDS